MWMCWTPEGDCDCEGTSRMSWVVGGECLEDANENGICGAVEELEFPCCRCKPCSGLRRYCVSLLHSDVGANATDERGFGTNELPMYSATVGFSTGQATFLGVRPIEPGISSGLLELVDDSYATVGLLVQRRSRTLQMQRIRPRWKMPIKRSPHFSQMTGHNQSQWTLSLAVHGTS